MNTFSIGAFGIFSDLVAYTDSFHKVLWLTSHVLLQKKPLISTIIPSGVHCVVKCNDKWHEVEWVTNCCISVKSVCCLITLERFVVSLCCWRSPLDVAHDSSAFIILELTLKRWNWPYLNITIILVNGEKLISTLRGSAAKLLQQGCA